MWPAWMNIDIGWLTGLSSFGGFVIVSLSTFEDSLRTVLE